MATKKPDKLTAAEVLSALKLVKNKSSTGYASKLAALYNFVQASASFNASIQHEIISVNDAGKEIPPDQMRKEMIYKLLNHYEYNDPVVKSLQKERDKKSNDIFEKRYRRKKTKKKDPSDIEAEIENLEKERKELDEQIKDLVSKEEQRLNKQLFGVDQMRQELSMMEAKRVEFITDTGRYSFLLPTNNRFYMQMCGLLKLPLPNEVIQEKKVAWEIVCPDNLTDCIKLAMRFTSGDDLRPAMQCICLDFNSDGVQVVATDAHRLYMSKRLSYDVVKRPAASKEFQLMISHQSLNKLYKSPIDRYEPCNVIVYEDGTGEINHVPVVYFTEGKYPDYKVVVPKYTEYVEFHRKDFIQSLSSAMVYSNKSTNLVALDINGQILMSGQDVDFSFESDIRMNYLSKTMPDTVIAFDAKLLKDSLSIFKDESVKMYSDGKPTHAGIFTNGVDEFLLMPLMLHQ